MNWKIVKTLAALGLASILAGCGAGGGGSSSASSYSIKLRTDSSSLPLNIAGLGPSIGGPYTTTLYIDAKDMSDNALGSGEGVFSCSVVGNLDSGALYYLDGAPEHETTQTINGVEVTTPNAYRAVTLDSNAGAATFHYHSTDIAGTITIRCSVANPDGTQSATEIQIQVGSAASGKLSQVVFVPFSPNYLFVQGMNNYTQSQVQLNMVDEAGQPVPNPGADNVEVNIVSLLNSTADDGAVLRGVNAAGQAVQGKSIRVASINGQAQVTLVTGTSAGLITLEAAGDRTDNNVGNGITERISNMVTVSVLTEDPGSVDPASPLSITTESLPAAAEQVSYGAVLEGSGGSAPYTWSLASGTRLPAGLTLSSTGVIAGTPYEPTTGVYSFVVKMTDSAGSSIQKGFTISYTAITTTPEETAPSVTTSTLSDCQVGQPCVRTVSASGGKSPYTWSAVGLPTGLSLSASGVLSGTPTTAGTFQFGIVATGANGLSSTAKIVTLTVTPNTGLLTVMTTSLPAGTAGSGYSTQILATGGTSPYTWSYDQLPAGLSMSANGVISGIPTVAGTFTIRVTVTDSVGATSYRDLSVTIASALVISTASPLPDGTAGVAYSVQLAPAGGTPPYTWAVVGGSLAGSGLTLSAAGLLSGPTPSAGVYVFTAEVTDSASATATKDFQVTINP